MAGSIKEMVQAICSAGMPRIVKGLVTSESPVKIAVNGDFKAILSEASLTVPKGKRPLKTGEWLYLLSYNNNKLYYVLDKV